MSITNGTITSIIPYKNAVQQRFDALCDFDYGPEYESFLSRYEFGINCSCSQQAFLTTTWLSEIPPPADQVKARQIMIPQEIAYAINKAKNNPSSMDTSYEPWCAAPLISMAETYNYLFPNPDDAPAYLNIEFIKSIHRRLMKHDQSSEPGEIRTTAVHSVSFAFFCLPPKITGRLEWLVAFYNTMLEKCDTSKKIICLHALFYSEYLLIHPHKDGNGRTARFLIAYLLLPHTDEPLALFAGSRTTYHDALQHRNTPWNAPTELTKLFIASIIQSRLKS